MKIALDLSFLRGCMYLEPKSSGTQLHRMTPGLMEFYRLPEHHEIRAACPSGVKLLFRTNSARISLPVDFGRVARPIYAFGILIDDRMSVSFVKNGVLELLLDGGMHTVEINLPHLVECLIGSLELEDGSSFIPVPRHSRSMVFIGDSIMQGMTVSQPCLAYADCLARSLNTESYNFSVGGAVMDGRLGELALECEWDRVLLGFGVNDFNTGRSLEEFGEQTRKALNFLTSRPGAEVYLLSPIPMAGEPKRNVNGNYLSDFCVQLELLAKTYPGVHLIDGGILLSNDVRLFVDGIHPNDKGERILFHNLLPYFE